MAQRHLGIMFFYHCLYYLDPNGWIGMTGYKFFSFNIYYSFSVFASGYGTISFTSN